MPQSPPLPNTGIILPTPGGDFDIWGTENNAALTILDGYCGDITPARLDIDDNLSMKSHTLQVVRSVQFDNQLSPISASEQTSEYSSGGELWYNDDKGNQVQITNNGVVNATAGSTTLNETSVSTDTTIGASDPYNWYNVDTSGAPLTITLPQASDVGFRFYYIRDFAGEFATNNVTIACAGSDTILDSGNISTAVLKIEFGTYMLVSDGSSHWSIDVSANYQNNLGIYSMVSLAVTENATVGGDFTVSGLTTLAGSVAVSGATSGSGPDVSIGATGARVGTFECYFPAEFFGSLQVEGDFIADADSTLNGSVTVNGTTTFATLVTFNGGSIFNNAAIFKNDVTVNSGHSVTIHSDLTADGDTTLSDTTINGNLTQTGDTTLGTNTGNTLTVNGAFEFKHSGSFDNNVTIAGNLTGQAATSLSNGEIVSDAGSHVTTVGSGSGAQVVLSSDNVEFNAYAFFNGNNKRLLLNYHAFTPSTNSSAATAMNITYKFCYISTASADNYVYIDYDTRLIGDFQLINNRSGHICEVHDGSSDGSVVASMSNGTWTMFVWSGGSWLAMMHGSN